MFQAVKFGFDVDILALLGLVTIWAILSKNWAIFYQSSGHRGTEKMKCLVVPG
jgi:hypothetical protein